MLSLEVAEQEVDYLGSGSNCPEARAGTRSRISQGPSSIFGQASRNTSGDRIQYGVLR